jgi:heme-degrading monooxygenase HmoA
MITERAELTIREGLEEEFAAAMRDRGLPILIGFDGVQSARIGRGIENPNKYMLLVEWTSMEAHAAFKQSDVYGPFTQIFGPYSIGGAMEHFAME